MTEEIIPSEGKRYHVVQPGENLSMIARKYYGAGQEVHWITLYNFNQNVIGDNPDFIQPGISLEIPDLTEYLTD